MPPARRSASLATVLTLTTCLVVGCGTTRDPATDRYVGNWQNGEDRLRIDRNGLGNGRVIRGRDERPFTWELGPDRITITFDVGNRLEVFEANIDEEGLLVVRSPRAEVRLERVATLPRQPGTQDREKTDDDAAPSARLPSPARDGV